MSVVTLYHTQLFQGVWYSRTIWVGCFKNDKQLWILTQIEMKEALRETQTLRAGGAKSFHPAADPLPGAQDRQNLISWRWSLPAPTDPVW